MVVSAICFADFCDQFFVCCMQCMLCMFSSVMTHFCIELDLFRAGSALEEGGGVCCRNAFLATQESYTLPTQINV